MRKPVLLTPGPTPLPDAVKQKLSGDIIHHRTEGFKQLLKRVHTQLQKLFQTENQVLMLSCTGTGVMEASIVNLFSPNDSVLVINGGKFGDRLVKISKTYGLRVAELKLERGKALEIGTLEQKIDEAKQTVSPLKAILFQASETSTGTRFPVQEIAKVARKHGLLSVCDAITALGVFDLPMDEWGLDVVMSASQKAFMLPPGLAFIAMSPKAWDLTKSSTLPKFYFNLDKERQSQLTGVTAWTPATQLIQALEVSLDLILNQEGLKNVFERHNRLAKATRAGVKALGLELFNEESPSDAVTAVKLPFSKDVGKLIPKTMRERFEVIATGGQDELEGHIVRLSHFGHTSIHDVVAGLSALGFALKEFGFECDVGEALDQCYHHYQL